MRKSSARTAPRWSVPASTISPVGTSMASSNRPCVQFRPVAAADADHGGPIGQWPVVGRPKSKALHETHYLQGFGASYPQIVSSIVQHIFCECRSDVAPTRLTRDCGTPRRPGARLRTARLVPAGATARRAQRERGPRVDNRLSLSELVGIEPSTLLRKRDLP